MYEKVKVLCNKKGISIYKLERDLKFSINSINKWRKSKPSVDKVKMVADYFQVSIEYFL